MSVDERIAELECSVGVLCVVGPEEDVYVVVDKVGWVGGGGGIVWIGPIVCDVVFVREDGDVGYWVVEEVEEECE